jgi:hypothetical protein
MFIAQRKKNIDCTHNLFHMPAKREPLVVVEPLARQRWSKLGPLRPSYYALLSPKIFAIGIDIR